MVKTRRQRADAAAANAAGFQDLPVDIIEVIAGCLRDTEDFATLRLLCKSAAQAGKAKIRRIRKESLAQRQLERYITHQGACTFCC
ncbi:hypothetical protein WJX73_006204 [Symbiochloris irregularis]|uniref:F-box domain-containing protein n=1 Tax=Symbiochloris irregularis TaxID=706552 RepID=A0AAW1NPS7_9CHLO